MYAVSKVAQLAYTFIVAREEYFAKTGVIVNAMCPGSVAADFV
jgi:NAD(P)-dependent dehydrogenase (short-subunit alcohol dehydrogenase family)